MERSLSRAENGLRALALCAVCVAPMGVLSGAAAEERYPRIIATHQWSASSDNGDGTYAVTFDVVFANIGTASIGALTVELIDAGMAPVLPRENILAGGVADPRENDCRLMADHHLRADGGGDGGPPAVHPRRRSR